MLDDPFFVADLDKVEIGQASEERLFHGPASAVDDGTANDDGDLARDGRHEQYVALIDDEPPARPRERLQGALVFVLMMMIGAGTAAMVFHDRVAQILR